MNNETEYWKLIKEISSLNEKWVDTLATKATIIDNLIKSIKPNSKTLLFTSFNPIALNLADHYDVTVICSSNSVFDMSAVKQIDNIEQLTQKFDIVVALDEYFTYGDSLEAQRDLLDQVVKVTNGWLITTLQDYKNFAPHKKNQIDTSYVSNGNNYIMLESNVADKTDKQLWYHYRFCIKEHNELITIGPSSRRTMYFKQLAKYSSDAGSKQYVIQKNLLYKGFFSKNFEHIITVNF